MGRSPERGRIRLSVENLNRMAFPKHTLDYNERRKRWELENDRTNRVVKRFIAKENALRSGVLKRAVGKKGASVKIQKVNGCYQEERTYPGSKDPSKLKG